jgi:hypothetical protein
LDPAQTPVLRGFPGHFRDGNPAKQPFLCPFASLQDCELKQPLVALKETGVDFVATRQIFYSSRRERSLFYSDFLPSDLTTALKLADRPP